MNDSARWLARATALSLAVVGAATSAAAQSTLAWRADFQTTQAAVGSLGVHAHPAGGGVQVRLEGFSAPSISARRFDGNGDTLWDVPVPTPSLLTIAHEPLGTAVTPAGSTVVAYGVEHMDPVGIAALDANGAPLWDVALTSGDVAEPLQFLGLGTAPDGDVRVLCVEQGYLPTGNENVVLVSLDGATGAEQWRYVAPRNGGGSTVVHGFDGELCYFTARETSGVRVECVDGDGAQVFATSGVQIRSSISQGVFGSIDPAGDFVLGHWEPAGVPGTHVARVAPDGTVRWRVIVPATFLSHLGGTATADGEVLLLDSGSITTGAQSRVDRLDSSGQALWTFVTPVPGLRFRRALPDPEGGTVLVGETGGGGQPFHGWLFGLDANGVETWREDFAVEHPGRGRVGGADLDPRGNLLFDLSHATDLTLLHLFELVVGDPQPSSVCTPTAQNSTGEVGRLTVAGSDAVGDGNLTLVADRLPASQFVLFLTSLSAGFTPNPGGSLGDLCLGGMIGRFAGPGQIRATDASGRTSLEIDLGALPQGLGAVPAAAGDVWHFQAWHRDSVGGAAVSNLTGAEAVTFQ